MTPIDFAALELKKAAMGRIAFVVFLCSFQLFADVLAGFSFVGFVTEARLRRTAAEGGRDQSVATVVQASAKTQPGDTLVRAVVTMEKSGARQLGVIDPGDGNRLIGMLTMSDIVRAHARAVLDADDVDQTKP